MRSCEAAVWERMNRRKKERKRKEEKERKNKRGERINYKLRRRLLGNMSLLDKPFIIFIAREHDKQEERNTIRSERITAWVSRHLSKISSTLIQGKSREAMKLRV